MYNHCLITGASSGIGQAVAIELAKRGVKHITLVGRDIEKLNLTAKLIKIYKTEVSFFAIDISDALSFKAMVLIENEKNPFDMVFACAGVSIHLDSLSTLVEDTSAINQVNIQGVLNTIEPFVSLFSEAQKGHIVLMSSLSALIPIPQSIGYAASKAWVKFYGEGLNALLSPAGVKVSVICPGYIKTPLTDRNRFYMPFLMDVAKASELIVKGLDKQKLFICFPKPLYYLLRFYNRLPLRVKTWALRQFSKNKHKFKKERL